MYKFLSIFLFFLPTLLMSSVTEEWVEEFLEQEKPYIFVNSTPRSSNTWLCYCLTHILEATNPFYKQGMFFSLPSFDSDQANYFIIKFHYLNEEHARWINASEEGKRLTLITILRDYKDLAVRYSLDHDKKLHKNLLQENIQKVLDNQFDSLTFFEEVQCHKMVIYYEDLISKPRETLETILTLFPGDHRESLDQFMAHYEEHKAHAMQDYNANFDRCHSQGKSNWHYKMHLTKKQREAIDALFATYRPKLYQKYLEVFREPS